MNLLSEELKTLSKHGVIDRDSIPDFIPQNLNQKFDLRDYQKEAIARFDFYLNSDKRKKPTQLLYHMATGSGKTLIMAANILYLYERGYRNFIFFVNSTSIIDKTRENFLNPQSNKYLFDDRINFGDKEVQVREVENFSAVNEEDINIKFTTIQGLHMHLNEPRENSITYEDFEDKEIVLISDEAHHINALTKSKSRLTKTDKQEINSWEGTVNKIFESNEDNILLEYTATAELNNEKVREKYEDKILYQYSLKEYRKDKFSKEVKVHQVDLPSLQRALQTAVVSQYRLKVAEKHKIRLKPVVMIKSNRVTEPDNYDIEDTNTVVSSIFRDRFHEKIKNLEAEDLKEIKDRSSESIVAEAFEYFEENNITLENLVKELKDDFSREKSISVDSKSQSEENQVLVNSLEDPDNEIRVVFAVDRLNEGWDVLNLFDIVRLYDTRDARKSKPGKTTVSEAQLIGRGARYYPFKVEEEQDKFKRKYDDDVDNDLRILEELHYHSAHNPRYISELRTALRDEGIIPEKESKECKMKVKDEFQESDFWSKGVIFLNERIENTRDNIFGLEDVEIDKEEPFEIKLARGQDQEIKIFEEDAADKIKETDREVKKLQEFGGNVVRKAVASFPFYTFDNLKKYFPKLNSIEEFIEDGDYLKNIKVELTGEQDTLYDFQFSQEKKLEVVQEVLSRIEDKIKNNTTEYEGTKEFKPINVEKKFKDEDRVEFTMNISVEGDDKEKGIAMSKTNDEDLNLKLEEKNWYVYEENYGTDQEKYLIRFIHNAIDDLEDKFEDVYLVRNENLFKIYRFSDGKAFEPDFVLFLSEENEETLVYQLFIEPKGEHLMDGDSWKEEFLEEIEEEYEIQELYENKDFRLIGMPFYNEDVRKQEFKNKFNKVIN